MAVWNAAFGRNDSYRAFALAFMGVRSKGIGTLRTFDSLRRYHNFKSIMDHLKKTAGQWIF